jgi:thymidylate kinase
MKSPEVIQKFIEYKRNVEKERPQLTAEPRLITIDGTDGAGKSTIARKFVEKLQKSFGKDRVLLVDITNLRGSPKQKILREIAEHKKSPRTN